MAPSVDPALLSSPSVRESLEETARTFRWRGTEDDEHRERTAACRARRKRYGRGSCEDRDGSCEECGHDMAVALETVSSKAARLAATAALSSALTPEGC